ncbi:hypothetical protein CR513_21184, partial [Mucuna pruriens]
MEANHRHRPWRLSWTVEPTKPNPCMELPKMKLQLCAGTLVGFLGEQIEIQVYLDLKTMFQEGKNAKTIPMKYMVINALTSYNLALNALCVMVSTLHLYLKYPIGDYVGTIRIDQNMANKSYLIHHTRA